MKGVALVAAVLLAGCKAGGSGGAPLTTAECEAFVGKFHQVTGTTAGSDLSLHANEYVEGCVSGKLGVSRQELECGTRAAGVEEWKACNIVFNP